MRRALGLALLLAACTPTTVVVPPSASPATAVPAATTAAVPRASTTATPLLPVTGSTISTRGAVTVPPSARIIALAFDDLTRVWLVDLSGNTSPVNIAAWRAPRPGFASELVLASADARSALIGASAPSGKAALYFYDVAAGRTTLLYEDPDTDVPWVLSPALSPDGRRFAFQTSVDVRFGSTAGGATERLVPHPEPHNVFGVWHPVAWSADGARLAMSRSSEGASELAVITVLDRTVRVLGPGTIATWRPDRPLLAVAAGVGAFGGRGLMYVYDAGTGAKTDLETPETWTIGPLRWDTNSDKLAFAVRTNFGPAAELWTRSPSGPPAKEVGAPRDIRDIWWSPVGSVLYSLVASQDAIAPGLANLEVISVGSSRIIASLCRQPPCP